MTSAKKQYTNEMKKKFGYYATWYPGVPRKIGDIGILMGNEFDYLSNLSEMDLPFEIVQDQTKTHIEHNSEGSVSVANKLSGSVPPMGSILTVLDAGIIVEFEKKFSTLFKANNTIALTIKDKIKLGEKILKLYDEGKWDKKWVVITELLEAESATVLISNSPNGKIELKANANINAPMIDIADAGFKFSVEFSRGLETKIVSLEGLTPLFKVMGIKSNIFTTPEVVSKSVMAYADEMNEPEHVDFKEDVVFDYIFDLNED